MRGCDRIKYYCSHIHNSKMGQGWGWVPVQYQLNHTELLAPLPPYVLLFLSVVPTMAFFDKPNLSLLIYCACFCESVIISALKPSQYIDIYKRYLASSEFSLCLSLWSCWMIGKNSGQAFLIIMTMKFLLARRKLTNRQNQMDTHTLIFYLTLFCTRNIHLIWPSQVFLLVPGFILLP